MEKDRVVEKEKERERKKTEMNLICDEPHLSDDLGVAHFGCFTKKSRQSKKGGFRRIEAFCSKVVLKLFETCCKVVSEFFSFCSKNLSFLFRIKFTPTLILRLQKE
jgi:hypothetical protein